MGRGTSSDAVEDWGGAAVSVTTVPCERRLRVGTGGRSARPPGDGTKGLAKALRGGEAADEQEGDVEQERQQHGEEGAGVDEVVGVGAAEPRQAREDEVAETRAVDDGGDGRDAHGEQ